MGSVTTLDFKAKARASADAQSPAALSDLFYGPFNHEDFLTLRRIQTIAQRDMDETDPSRPLLYEGYTFDQHMTLHLSANRLSTDLQRVTQNEKSEFPPESEFADLRKALGKLRSHIHIQHILVMDCDSDDIVQAIDRIKSHADFYMDMLGRIRGLEDKIDNYSPPLRASVSYISPGPK